MFKENWILQVYPIDEGRGKNGTCILAPSAFLFPRCPGRPAPLLKGAAFHRLIWLQGQSFLPSFFQVFGDALVFMPPAQVLFCLPCLYTQH